MFLFCNYCLMTTFYNVEVGFRPSQLYAYQYPLLPWLRLGNGIVGPGKPVFSQLGLAVGKLRGTSKSRLFPASRCWNSSMARRCSFCCSNGNCHGRNTVYSSGLIPSSSRFIGKRFLP